MMRSIVGLAVAIVCFSPISVAAKGILVEDGYSPAIEPDELILDLVTLVHAEVEDKADDKFERLEPMFYRKRYERGWSYLVKVRAIDKDTKEASFLHLEIYTLPFDFQPELVAIRRVNEDDNLIPLPDFVL